MYCCCCLEIMLRVGLTSSMSCNVVAVWRLYFVWLLLAVCLVMLCHLETTVCVHLTSSMSYGAITIW